MGLYADQLKQIQNAIGAAEGGTTYVIGVRTYGAGDLDELYAREEMLSCSAAIQTIQEGAQSYTIRGRQFTHADLGELHNRRDTARVRLNRVLRKTTGLRVGRVVHE